MQSSWNERQIRDKRLLDALESVEQERYEGVVWRTVRQGRDPLTCWRSGGRWDDGSFDVLYTSESREAAIAERKYHLFQGQPFPPSNIDYELFELRLSLESIMRLADLQALAFAGLDPSHYGKLSYLQRTNEYPRTQEIAEVCHFLGADGLLVPSAREEKSNNLIVFCEQNTKIQMDVVRNHGVVNFK